MRVVHRTVLHWCCQSCFVTRWRMDLISFGREVLCYRVFCAYAMSSAVSCCWLCVYISCAVYVVHTSVDDCFEYSSCTCLSCMNRIFYASRPGVPVLCKQGLDNPEKSKKTTHRVNTSCPSSALSPSEPSIGLQACLGSLCSRGERTTPAQRWKIP